MRALDAGGIENGGSVGRHQSKRVWAGWNVTLPNSAIVEGDGAELSGKDGP
jgi:hypothetical protein